VRIRDAAEARGYSEQEIDRLAMGELAAATGAYRTHHPRARGIDLSQPDLFSTEPKES
jgi:hypothetical protein